MIRSWLWLVVGVCGAFAADAAADGRHSAVE